MAGAQPREANPPPVIGKAGRYTVFITPPAIPEARKPCSPRPNPRLIPSPRNESPLPAKAPPPVQVPPQQFEKPAARSPGSLFGFFWDAVAKVQDVHSSVDEYLADWFGLNQSKYQWALNDYYENNGMEKEGGKAKELSSKGQAV